MGKAGQPNPACLCIDAQVHSLTKEAFREQKQRHEKA